MTLEQLRAERKRIEAEMSAAREEVTRIKAQLEHAEADGDYDLHWAANARTALRYKNRKLLELQSSLGKVSRQTKDVLIAENERRFCDTAKRMLPPDVFERIAAEIPSIARDRSIRHRRRVTCGLLRAIR
jgi:chromosome segregation ATPase